MFLNSLRRIISSCNRVFSSSEGMWATQKKPRVASPTFFLTDWFDSASAAIRGCFRAQQVGQSRGSSRSGPHPSKSDHSSVYARDSSPSGSFTVLSQSSHFCLRSRLGLVVLVVFRGRHGIVNGGQYESFEASLDEVAPAVAKDEAAPGVPASLDSDAGAGAAKDEAAPAVAMSGSCLTSMPALGGSVVAEVGCWICSKRSLFLCPGTPVVFM